MENDRIKRNSMDALISDVLRQWMRNKKQLLNEFDLTASQYELLSAIDCLAHRKKEIIQVELSEQAMVGPMTASVVLRALEKKGYILRSRGRVNTRIMRVELTESGKTLYHQASSKVNAASETLFRNLDGHNLTRQLRLLSNELNKLNN